jgi:MFS family permease
MVQVLANEIGADGSSYLLTTTALQPLYGRLYKLFNVKLIFLGAVFIFEVGSLISAVAPTSTAFIVGRAVAGVCTPLRLALLWCTCG